MKLSAAYKWAGHVAPSSWPDWKDHMARAGEDEEGAEVGLRERLEQEEEEGRRGARLEGRGTGGGGEERTAWTHARARGAGTCGRSAPGPARPQHHRRGYITRAPARPGHEEFVPRRRHDVRRPQGYETVTAQDLLTTTGDYNPFIFAWK